MRPAAIAAVIFSFVFVVTFGVVTVWLILARRAVNRKVARFIAKSTFTEPPESFAEFRDSVGERRPPRHGK